MTSFTLNDSPVPYEEFLICFVVEMNNPFYVGKIDGSVGPRTCPSKCVKIMCRGISTSLSRR